jgi:hypothetical protein
MMTNGITPLEAGEILQFANDGKPIPADRVLATFANPDNWVQIYEGKATRQGYEARACEWAFIGPMRPPYELAQHAMSGEPTKPTGFRLKFCILAHGDVERENVLYILNTSDERDTKTFELIYGHSIPETAQESDMWAADKEELNDSGELDFEGDPGLRWFVALMS